MNDNFEVLKNEVCKIIENNLSSNIIMFAEIETLKIIMERLGLEI